MFANGNYHGKGKYIWIDGDTYDGQYVHGLKHGHGTYEFPDGQKYVGNFVKDKK